MVGAVPWSIAAPTATTSVSSASPDDPKAAYPTPWLASGVAPWGPTRPLNNSSFGAFGGPWPHYMGPYGCSSTCIVTK